MRDVVAGIVALALLLAAGRLGTALRGYRRRRERLRDSERALGRTVIVEIPGADDLVLFSEDAVRFHYGERSIDKDLIVAVRLMINGATIAEGRRGGAGAAGAGRDAGLDPGRVRDDRLEQGEGIARDRWDVEIETVTGSVLVECGAIRERVSQELARAVFDAVRRAVDHHSRSGALPR
jgi:hypothetical protein